MELNPDTVAEQLGVLIVEYGQALNLHLRIPIDVEQVADQTNHAPQAVLKLHLLLRLQGLEGTVALVAHGFLNAWNAMVIVSYEMFANRDPGVREAAEGSYSWLCGQAMASIEFLKSHADGA